MIWVPELKLGLASEKEDFFNKFMTRFFLGNKKENYFISNYYLWNKLCKSFDIKISRENKFFLELLSTEGFSSFMKEFTDEFVSTFKFDEVFQEKFGDSYITRHDLGHVGLPYLMKSLDTHFDMISRFYPKFLPFAGYDFDKNVTLLRKTVFGLLNLPEDIVLTEIKKIVDNPVRRQQELEYGAASIKKFMRGVRLKEKQVKAYQALQQNLEVISKKTAEMFEILSTKLQELVQKEKNVKKSFFLEKNIEVILYYLDVIRDQDPISLKLAFYKGGGILILISISKFRNGDYVTEIRSEIFDQTIFPFLRSLFKGPYKPQLLPELISEKEIQDLPDISSFVESKIVFFEEYTLKVHEDIQYNDKIIKDEFPALLDRFNFNYPLFSFVIWRKFINYSKFKDFMDTKRKIINAKKYLYGIYKAQIVPLIDKFKDVPSDKANRLKTSVQNVNLDLLGNLMDYIDKSEEKLKNSFTIYKYLKHLMAINIILPFLITTVLNYDSFSYRKFFGLFILCFLTLFVIILVVSIAIEHLKTILKMDIET
ncbi:hypothetical protein KY361_03090 [Candidatus Woesearchaeota archaeon]|nr:hypothetical protein [Candidatus Woesearchaeota archaeon]